MSSDVKSQLGGNKRLRRKWITWTRMVRYGANNFTRNAWLTTAATAVMTITLLVIFTSFFARLMLNETVDGIRKRVDIPINLRSDISETEIKRIKSKLEAQSNVAQVNYISLEQSKSEFIKKNNLSAEELQTISELPNPPFYPILKVIVDDPTDTSGLASLVSNDREIKDALNKNPTLAPSFSGEKKKVIETISNWASTAEQVGVVAGSLFIAISMLIIFNTIRMAIFSRKDEIEMMKLIGADKGFIRGPFVVEAVMYGFFAAVFATILGILAFLNLEPKLVSYGIATSDLHDNIMTFSPLILLAMILIGGVIGVLSSRLAVRRYLKV